MRSRAAGGAGFFSTREEPGFQPINRQRLFTQVCAHVLPVPSLEVDMPRLTKFLNETTLHVPLQINVMPQNTRI
jgi:hypothetical protein